MDGPWSNGLPPFGNCCMWFVFYFDLSFDCSLLIALDWGSISKALYYLSLMILSGYLNLWVLIENWYLQGHLLLFASFGPCMGTWILFERFWAVSEWQHRMGFWTWRVSCKIEWDDGSDSAREPLFPKICFWVFCTTIDILMIPLLLFCRWWGCWSWTIGGE
jgi:hypothetical protein